MNITEQAAQAIADFKQVAPYAGNIRPAYRQYSDKLIDGDIVITPGGFVFEVFSTVGWLTRPSECTYYHGTVLDKFGSWEQDPELKRDIIYYGARTGVQVYRRR